MTLATVKLTLRLRLSAAFSAAFGLVAVMAAVGALFPAVGHTIGTLNVPKSVENLLGGADYGTVTGWFRGEIASIYGPLVIGAIAITGACASLAGEEEDRIMGLVLSYPITRSQLVLAKTAAVTVTVIVVAAGIWLGLIVGVALAGGGITLAHMTALAVQTAFFGFAVQGVAVALAATTGRRSFSVGVAAAIAILGWLVHSFAPLVSGLGWLKYLSFFYYYAGHDPLTQGVDWVGALVLTAAAALLTAAGMFAFSRRDLRA